MTPMPKRLLTLPALLLVLTWLSACGSSLSAPPATRIAPAGTPTTALEPAAGQPSPAPATAGSEHEVAAAPTDIPPTATPADPFPGEGPWNVVFEAEDGVALGGTVYGKGETALVLVPMYPGEPAAWESFARRAAEQGYRALAFDLRGHGESAGEASLAASAADVEAAIAYLQSHDAGPIIVVAAGPGTIPAIQVAARSGALDGLALLSPLPADGDAEVTSSDLSALALPTLWLAARTDMTHQTEEMAEQAGGDPEVWIYEGSSLRGTYLFEGADAQDVTRRLLEFVERVTSSG